MATALHSARTRFFDKCGKPLCGGTVHTYQVGSTTAKPTYTDVSKTAVNTNPVILDSIGSAAIFLDGAYRVRVLDRNGVLVEDIAYVESWISATEKDNIYQAIDDVDVALNNHAASTENPHKVTKSQVGLSNVDNTADIDKPISSAVGVALSLKADKATTLAGYGITDSYTQEQLTTLTNTLSATTYAGHKGYPTLASAQAAQASLPANTLVEVTNDTTTTNNGVYLWDGSALTKSSFDAVAQSKQVVNTAVYGKVNTIEDTVIYSEDGVKLITVPYLSDFFAADLQVKSGDYYLINANSYGDVRAYYIADANDKLLKYSDSVVTNELVQMPSNAVRLVVNCTKATRNSFYVKLLTSTDVDLLNKIKAIDPSNNITVASAFPQRPSYSFLLKDKCPNFYKKLKEKSDDFTVCLTGTSLTQGNLYATDRSDGTTRPPQLHTNDLASAIFDSLISHWDGQQYRRYDHVDLSYSASNWTVTNDAQSGGTSIWDDRAEYRNGLTKTTTYANASVAMTIPANAWQFNFIHRTDSQGGNRTVTISQGSGLVEAFNGSAWVEANGFVFSSLEPAATTTKGNTIYQKRLKMRCKNKVGGINSIGQTKTITISKGNDACRFNVVGFEWSQREFMLTLINSARGSHNWGLSNGYNLENYQDGDIWEFNPDLLLCETTTINWGGSWGYDVDPLYYVNIAKRAYFNEFNDNQNSLYVKSNAYRNCDVIFYGDTVSAHTDQSASWDGQQPKFATVTTAANNGNSSTENVGRVKNIFENYAEVESYMASKEYVFIPVSAVFKNVANKYFGNYWDAFRDTDKAGATLSYDAIHLNDNGYKLWSLLICPLFDNL